MSEPLLTLTRLLDIDPGPLNRDHLVDQVSEASIATITQLVSTIAAMRDDIFTLVKESHGVTGLHRNGEVAYSDELMPGGRFEEWLQSLNPPSQVQGSSSLRVLADVLNERHRQDRKWGGSDHDDQHTVGEFLSLIKNYAGWAEVMAGMNSPEKARRRAMQVAALAVALCECFDRAEARQKESANA